MNKTVELMNELCELDASSSDAARSCPNERHSAGRNSTELHTHRPAFATWEHSGQRADY